MTRKRLTLYRESYRFLMERTDRSVSLWNEAPKPPLRVAHS